MQIYTGEKLAVEGKKDKKGVVLRQYAKDSAKQPLTDQCCYGFRFLPPYPARFGDMRYKQPAVKGSAPGLIPIRFRGFQSAIPRPFAESHGRLLIVCFIFAGLTCGAHIKKAVFILL